MAEEKKRGPKDVKKSGPSKPAKSQSEGKEEAHRPEETQTVSMYLAIGLVIGALVMGMAIGYVVAPKGGVVAATNVPGGSAPPLSEEQLRGGTLPEGHPQIPTGGESTQSGSESTTAAPENSGK